MWLLMQLPRLPLFSPDVDECATENGQCEAACENTIGTYICACPIGLRLRNDGRTCAGELVKISH